MVKPIPMAVWPSSPRPVRPKDWPGIAAERSLAVLPYHALCTLAGVSPRVSGPDLQRRIHILSGEEHLRPVGRPDILGVALPDFRGQPRDGLAVLEILAYGFLDYAARETVRGRGLYLPVKGRGRRACGKALSGAERMRRLRNKAVSKSLR